ncbi:MAG: glycosyltransferase family 4 protein [Anaerolineales bacterium]|nr:glycosyltransferase family 4 protein [Anaerolineales bacterium]
MSKATKRHCMIVHAYYPEGETRVQREAGALIDVGYEVDVICLRKPGESRRDSIHGVDVYRLSVRRHKGSGVLAQLIEYLAFFFLAMWRLTSLHLQKRYNAVQVHNPPDFLVFVTLIPRLMGAKVILDLHDLMPEFYASRFGRKMDSWPVRLMRWQEQLSCRFANHVITVTEIWRQDLIKRGLPASKCSVVMNLADDTFFNPKRRNNRPSINDNFTLLYHGTLVQRYGIDLILHAVDQLSHELPALCLNIHGGGEYLRDLQSLTHELGLDEYVNFSTIYVPVEELPDLIVSADLCLVPYRRDVFTDGILPTKMMEYAALGMPVVATRTPAIEAYFDETMAAFFTAGQVDELASRIRELYHNPSKREALANNIHKFNQQYNWTKQKAEYANRVNEINNLS